MSNFKWLTVREAAAYLKVSEGTIRKWVKGDMIPFSRIGRQIRFDRARLNEWIESEASSV